MPLPPVARTFSALGLLLAALALCVPALAAGEGDIWGDFPALSFARLTAADGLPHDTVSAVAQDRDGLLWIGTQAGLARYDGYRMQRWEADPGRPGSLPDNYIRALLPLSDGGMLVGTGAGGVARYDPWRDQFIRLLPPDGDSGRVLAIEPSRTAGGDSAWIATDDGLFHWRAGEPGLRHVDIRLSDDSAVNPRLFTVFEDANGDLWLGGVAGLLYRRAGQTHFTRIRGQGPAAIALAGDIWAILRDSAGRLWVGSGDAGLVYLHPADGKLRAVAGLSGPDGLAGRRTVRGFTEVPGGDIWIATDGAGLLIHDPRTGRTRAVRHDPVLPGSIGSDRMRASMVDRSGNIWLVTSQGLERYDPYAARVRIVPSSPLNPMTLSNGEVFAALDDGRGRVWVGLADGAIDVLDLPAGRIHRLHMPPPHNGRDVQVLRRLDDGTLLAGGRGVVSIDPRSLAITPGAVPCADGRIIVDMAVDGSDVWLGSYDGLLRYSPATGECTVHRHDAARPDSLVSDHVRAVLRLPDGRIAVATAAGLSVGDRSGRFRSFRPDPADPAALPHGFVTGLALDGHGRLWLSTAGGGLVVTDVEDLARTPRFRAMRRGNGLPHDNVGGVGVDGRGRIWFTTPSRIGMLDPPTGRFTLLGARDGATMKYYVLRALAWGPDGSLLLGGLGGLAILDTDGAADPPPPGRLQLTGLSVNHQRLLPSSLPAAGGVLRLSALERTLALDFALLDFRSAADLRYRHRLEGFDAGWVDSPPRAPGASYTNLPAGDYVLVVQALTEGPDALAGEMRLSVTVAPFWYETLWARIGALLALLALVAAIVQARTRALRRQRGQLEAEVTARTRDLVTANARLDMLASTDPLTGLLNRRRFMELALHEHMRACRYGRPLSVILIDLDHFKQVNDSHGHRMGDAVLRTAADMLEAGRRGPDLAARFGGEELVLLLPETALAGAAELAERLRLSLAAARTSLDGVEVGVTASLGVAGWRGASESLDSLLHRADTALYAAKNSGRNKVIVAAAPD